MQVDNEVLHEEEQQVSMEETKRAHRIAQDLIEPFAALKVNQDVDMNPPSLSSFFFAPPMTD